MSSATIRWSQTEDGKFIPANLFTCGFALAIHHRDKLKERFAAVLHLSKEEAVEVFEWFQSGDPRIEKYMKPAVPFLAEFNKTAMEMTYTKEQVDTIARAIETQHIFNIGH
jgi:hypothetical protein